VYTTEYYHLTNLHPRCFPHQLTLTFPLSLSLLVKSRNFLSLPVSLSHLIFLSLSRTLTAHNNSIEKKEIEEFYFVLSRGKAFFFFSISLRYTTLNARGTC
jgi:hypothetical protein